MNDPKTFEFAHAHDVKVYVTANILAHNEDLPGVYEYFKELKEIGPDGSMICISARKIITQKTSSGIRNAHCSVNKSLYLHVLRKKFVQKSSVISVHRLIILIMEPICFGTD